MCDTKKLVCKSFARSRSKGIIYDQFQHMRSLFNTSSHEHQEVYLAHKPKLSLILFFRHGRVAYSNLAKSQWSEILKKGHFLKQEIHNIFDFCMKAKRSKTRKNVFKQYNFPFILAVELICTSFSFIEHCADYEHDRAANMITP